MAPLFAADVTRTYGEPWVRYVRSIVEKIDAGRARIATHHSELVHLLQVGSEVAAARAAESKLSETLRRRLRNFPASYADDVRNGPVWDVLLRDYLMARTEIRRVYSALISVIATILDVDRSISSSESLETTRLTSAQRAFLQRANTRFKERTDRLLEQAGLVFDAGRRSTTIIASSQPMSATD